MADRETFKVFAIKYAELTKRTMAETYIGGDSHEISPIDYFVWAVVGPRTTWVVDTGFNPKGAKERGRSLIRTPMEGLKLVGVDSTKVENVILTHMHWDHAGNFDQFPKAKFHLQDREMAYCTGRYMAHAPLRRPFALVDVFGVINHVYTERVVFTDGCCELTPGLSIHLVGGHSNGLQIVRVWTRRGWVVLASDACHFYVNMDEKKPFPILFHLGDMMEGWETCKRLADGPKHVVPGHDPLVLERYPAPKPKLKGIVARLDANPLY